MELNFFSVWQVYLIASQIWESQNILAPFFYVGDVVVNARYRLTNENGLELSFLATTTKPTPINLANHCYFNLGKPIVQSYLYLMNGVIFSINLFLFISIFFIQLVMRVHTRDFMIMRCVSTQIITPRCPVVWFQQEKLQQWHRTLYLTYACQKDLVTCCQIVLVDKTTDTITIFA